MDPVSLFLLTIAGIFLVGVAGLARTERYFGSLLRGWDAQFYYACAHSLVFDRDLDITNNLESTPYAAPFDRDNQLREDAISLHSTSEDAGRSRPNRDAKGKIPQSEMQPVCRHEPIGHVPSGGLLSLDAGFDAMFIARERRPEIADPCRFNLLGQNVGARHRHRRPLSRQERNALARIAEEHDAIATPRRHGDLSDRVEVDVGHARSLFEELGHEPAHVTVGVTKLVENSFMREDVASTRGTMDEERRQCAAANGIDGNLSPRNRQRYERVRHAERLRVPGDDECRRVASDEALELWFFAEGQATNLGMDTIGADQQIDVVS